MDAEMKSSIWRRLIFSGEKQPEANTLDVKERRFEPLSRRWFIHSARTALAAVLSLYAARALRLPEAYWAAVSTIVVMQSTLGAAFEISEKTFIGTALGCGLAMLLARYFETNGIVFGAAVFGVGLLCSILRLDKSAYQFAGITLTIVLLAAGNRPMDCRSLPVHRGLCRNRGWAYVHRTMAGGRTATNIAQLEVRWPCRYIIDRATRLYIRNLFSYVFKIV